MSRTEDIDVLVSEVGPRDGLQFVDRTMPLPMKTKWVDALAAAGLREIEVGSFVSPKRLPQMSDTVEVVRHAVGIDDLNVLALVPNLRGAQDAVAAGAHAVSMPISASREHSIANIGKTPEEAVEQVRDVARFIDDTGAAVSLEVGISTAFGCTLQGQVSEDWVIEIASRCADAGAGSVGLSDTTGMANPAQVKRMFVSLQSELGERAGGAHLHNTRGQGLANAIAALEAGVTTLDSSHGGLGGCPYAPGASGNVVTEDLVYLLEAMGLRTGVDIDKLIEARTILEEGLPGEPIYGHVPEVGVHKGFAYAAAVKGA